MPKIRRCEPFDQPAVYGQILQQSTILVWESCRTFQHRLYELLATVVPSLEKLRKEESGRRKIRNIPDIRRLCIIQAVLGEVYRADLVYQDFSGSMLFWTTSVLSLTAGTIFLMWLGEQIDNTGWKRCEFGHHGGYCSKSRMQSPWSVSRRI